MLLLVAWGAAGQRTVTGRTVTGDGSPIEGVSVSVEGSGVGTTTDRLGRFSLDIPAELAGDSLSLTHVSYSAIMVPVAAAKEGTTYTLTPRSIVAAEVVVKARRGRKAVLDTRGHRDGLWAWTFSSDLAELGSFVTVEEQFLIGSFRFGMVRESVAPLRAEIVIYKQDPTAWRGWRNILSDPIYVDFDPSTPYYMEAMHTKPFEELEWEEDGFIVMNNFRERIKTVELEKPLLLEKGSYVVSLRYVMNATGVDPDQHPWMLPRFAAYGGMGMRRAKAIIAGEPSPFEPSDKNAGIIVVGYGK
jgi:hypothetical protein